MHHHRHHHPHDHGHGAEGRNDFDWAALNEALELDARLAMPIVDRVLDGLLIDRAAVRNVLDVGCGPGVFSCDLGHRFPQAEMIALDSSSTMLDAAAGRAVDCGLASRTRTIEADLEAPLPVLPACDLVFASMVLHHVGDPVAVLRGLRETSAPGGRLVIVEFAAGASALPADDPSAAAWAALEAAVTAARNERLGLDPALVEWPRLLGDAGWREVTDEHATAEHHSGTTTSPVRRWVGAHITRGLDLAGEALSDEDRATLQVLAASAPSRNDLHVTIHRRVLTARV